MNYSFLWIVLLLLLTAAQIRGAVETPGESCAIGQLPQSKNSEAEIDYESDYFTDLWGYKVNWRDEDDGWDAAKRESLAGLHLATKLQQKYVPKLTELGE